MGLRQGFSRAGAWVGLALLAACVAYRPAPISAQAEARAFAARRLDDARLARLMAATGVAAPGASGWGLGQLTLAALYFHPRMVVAKAAVAVAAGDARVAGEMPNPTLGFEELSLNASHAAPTPFTVAPVLNFLIETAGKRQDRMARQAALLRAARDAVAMTAWQVRAGVRAAWLSVWAGRRHLALLRARAALRGDLAEAMATRARVGDADATAALAARLAAMRTGAAAETAADDLAEDEAALASAIGVPVAALDGVRLDFRQADAPPALPDAAALAQLRAQALTGRADMRAALARYAAAEAGLKLAVASQYPDITLTPGYSYDQGQNKYMLYPILELPVFNRHGGEIAAALARRRAAAADFMQTEDEAIEAMDAAVRAAREATLALVAARRAAALARRLDAASARGFAAGAMDRTARDAARLSALDAEEALLQARVDDVTGLGALEDATQTPLLGGARVMGAARMGEDAAGGEAAR